MRPHSESYVSLLLLTFTTIFPLQSMSAEREGILMGFRLNTISPSGAQLGQGFGCGVQIIFVIPGRLQGDLGVSLFSSSQEPLTRIYVPGWRFREATSRISLIPVSMGVTYLLSGGRLRPYLGGGVSWWVLNERIEAVFVRNGYVLTTWRSFGGGGPGGDLSVGLSYSVTPGLSLFSEVQYAVAFIDYWGESVRVRGPVLSAGLRF